MTGTPEHPGPGRLVEPSLRSDLVAINEAIPLDAGGGGSLLKVLVLADLIIAHDLNRVVEIGVYRGRLLLPLARLLTFIRRGEAIGIDPYSASAAVQHDEHRRPIDLIAWAHSVDWETLYEELLSCVDRWKLGDRCRILRRSSQDAGDAFGRASIDLLHVDGNHDCEAVARDVELFLPKVRPGGFVVLDDASWPSVRQLCDELSRANELVFQLFDGAGVTVDGIGGNDFAVFRLAEGHQ